MPPAVALPPAADAPPPEPTEAPDWLVVEAVSVADAQAAIGSQLRLPAGTYLEWGGQFENLQSASERLKLVIPACFILILRLLLRPRLSFSVLFSFVWY